MEDQTESMNGHPHMAVINTFCEITNCAFKSEALFFLESHNFDLDAAVSTFFDTGGSVSAVAVEIDSPVRSQSQDSPSGESESPPRRFRSPSPPPASRSFRSPSPPPASRSYNLCSSASDKTAAAAYSGRKGRTGSRIKTLGDLKRVSDGGDESDGDPDFDPQECYTGGQKSGMLVQDSSRSRAADDVDAIFDQARQSGAVQRSVEHLLPPTSRSFTGTVRLLSGEASFTPHHPEVINHYIICWRNGFTVDNGPLRMLDDPESASFLESISMSECPKELAPADKRTKVLVSLTRKDENYQEPQTNHLPFQGVARTLGSTSDMEPSNIVITALTAAPNPSPTLVVDNTQPSTSIQLRLADGTRLIAHFNNYHTIRDVRGFIDASRPDVPPTYQLQMMGFPPKQLTDLCQTIDQAGIANSVVIQKL
ncbi:plant UBX domain-containing protein 3-like [Primulina tabacum]|uniref:plant UBX domain-containing protein 3-like n=1 Tax=Primulina tabacum TaxID=48773 RepID=UPI003F59C1B9